MGLFCMIALGIERHGRNSCRESDGQYLAEMTGIEITSHYLPGSIHAQGPRKTTNHRCVRTV